MMPIVFAFFHSLPSQLLVYFDSLTFLPQFGPIYTSQSDQEDSYLRSFAKVIAHASIVELSYIYIV